MKSWGWGTWCAILLTAFTLAYGFWVERLAWEPQAGFDILGILYLLSNLPNLIAWAVLLLFVCLTVWAWWLVISARHSDLDWPKPLIPDSNSAASDS